MSKRQRGSALLILLAAILGLPDTGTRNAYRAQPRDLPGMPDYTDAVVPPAPVKLVQARANTADDAKPDTVADTADSGSSGNSAPAQTKSSAPQMRSGVPEGFEPYTEAQKTLVEVHFGNEPVTSVMAEFTPETIEFLEPEKIVQALDGIRNRTALLEHLRQPLPTNSSRVCVRPGQQDCGTLAPEDVGVIFDARRFRADLHLDPDFLRRTDTDAETYLGEDADMDLGLVQNLSVNHAGNSDSDDRFSLFGRSRVGQGTRHLFSSWASTDEQDLSVDELGYRQDFRDHQFTAGLFESRIGQLTALRQDPVAGVSLARTFNRRRDLDNTFATDVDIVLNSRARVELLRDGRLQDVRFYEAGRHRIDTDRLPSGAYDLQIRITESGGRTRTLERFFVKSRRLAPEGERLWFSQIGRVHRRDRREVFPEDAGTMIARGGVQYRHGEQLGLGLAGAAIEDEGLLEFSTDWLSPGLQTHASVFADTEGGSGWLMRGSASRNDWRLIADAERIRTGERTPEDDYTLLQDDIDRQRVEIRAPAMGGQFFASWRHVRRNDTPGQSSTRMGYTRTVRLAGQQNLNISAQVGRTDGDAEALLSLDWRLTRQNWQHQARLAGRHSERSGDPRGASGQFRSTWQDGNTFNDELQVSAGVEAEDNLRRASLDAQHSWQYGRGRAGVSWEDRDERANRRVSSATYDTNLVATPDAAAVGGPELNQAGVIVDLRGAEGALFDILVDGKQRFVARGGRRAALTLPAYDDYQITIRDRGTDFVHYDGSPRRVTLYPGNVVNLKWELQRVFIVLGVLVDPDGNPLGGAEIEGTRSVTVSDPDGYFQGEIRGKDAALFARVNGGRCRLDTGPLEIQQGVARLGRVVCHPVTDAGDSGEMTAPADGSTRR